jgi:hypothetical protein
VQEHSPKTGPRVKQRKPFDTIAESELHDRNQLAIVDPVGTHNVS